MDVSVIAMFRKPRYSCPTLPMMDIHLFQVLFLQCLKLFTQNAFDSWVDAFMLLLYFMLMIDIVKKKKFHSSTGDCCALSEWYSLGKRITELNTQ